MNRKIGVISLGVVMLAGFVLLQNFKVQRSRLVRAPANRDIQALGFLSGPPQVERVQSILVGRRCTYVKNLKNIAPFNGAPTYLSAFDLTRMESVGFGQYGVYPVYLAYNWLKNGNVSEADYLESLKDHWAVQSSGVTPEEFLRSLGLTYQGLRSGQGGIPPGSCPPTHPRVRRAFEGYLSGILLPEIYEGMGSGGPVGKGNFYGFHDSCRAVGGQVEISHDWTLDGTDCKVTASAHCKVCIDNRANRSE
jgi:hypothetical protein